MTFNGVCDACGHPVSAFGVIVEAGALLTAAVTVEGQHFCMVRGCSCPTDAPYWEWLRQQSPVEMATPFRYCSERLRLPVRESDVPTADRVGRSETW